MIDPKFEVLVEYLKEFNRVWEEESASLFADPGLVEEAAEQKVVVRTEEGGKAVYTLPAAETKREPTAEAPPTARAATPTPRSRPRTERRGRGQIELPAPATPEKLVRAPVSRPWDGPQRFPDEFSEKVSAALAVVSKHKVVGRSWFDVMFPGEVVDELKKAGQIIEWPNSLGTVEYVLVSDGSDRITKLRGRALAEFITCLSLREVKEPARKYRNLLADHASGLCGCAAASMQVLDNAGI